MSCVRLMLPAAILALVTVSGCGSARMIQSSPDGGVVAIPSNSNDWPCRYKDSAEKLMAQKCPNGYDIVDEREFVIGQKSTTSAVTPASYQPNGPTATAVVTQTSEEKEYRITFRARPPVPTSLPPMPMPGVASPVLPMPPPMLPPAAAPGLPPAPVPIAAR